MAARPSSNRQRGSSAEQQAASWLCSQGLALIARNWHCRQGELDLVMQDDQTLVFVEVRLRNQQHFGGAAASVTPAKQLRLQQAASLFLADRPEWADHPCRFDVLGISQDNGCYNFNWIKNAFYGD